MSHLTLRCLCVLLGDLVLGLGKVLASYPAHGTRLGRCRDETNLFVPLICLIYSLCTM